MTPAPSRRKISLLHRLEYIGVLIVYGLVRMLGLERASRWCGWIWCKIAPLTARQKRATEHLRLAFPEKTDAEIIELTRAMWTHLGQIMGETFFLDQLANQKHRIEVEPATLAQMPKILERGSVMVSLHMGNWEVLGIAAQVFGLNMASLYQKLSNPLVEQFLLSMREPTYPAGLYSKGHASVRKVMQHGRNGNCVGLLADFRDMRGVPVEFFGHQAYCTPFPAMLARGYDLPLYACRLRRVGNIRFLLELVPVEVPRTEDRKADIQAATGNFHAIFEDWIRQAPEQWMWAHRKWAKRGSRIDKN